MRDYGKVLPQFWTGQTGRSLRGNPTAQIVALYLQTSPHANMIGVFHCPIVYIAHETGCPPQGASKALRSLSEAGFLTWDEASDLVWVHEMARFQIGESLKPGDKRVVAIRKEFEKLPTGHIRRGFHARYRDAFHLGPDGENEGPSQAPSDGSPKPLRSQYQEQEQEQDQKQEQETGTATSSPRVRVSREAPTEFLDFKLAYPDRSGDQKWRAAIRAANARIREGHSWPVLIAGAKRYAAYCAATDITGTQFVKTAAAFLGPDEPFLADWTPPATKAERKQDRNVAASVTWLEKQETVDATR